MLIILILFGIFVGIQRLLNKSIERNIHKAHNTEEALVYRKRLKLIRTIFYAVFISIYILVVFWINFGGREIDSNTLFSSFLAIFLGIIMLIYFLRQQKNYEKFVGNISTLSKKEYLTLYKHFAIFLRAFEDDDYADEELLFKRKSFKKFSEYKFMEIAQTKMPTCAIGMTKETDSPCGATRVYVDDTSWKDDVRELMDKADAIYILVNDRPSCIWEIEQCIDMLEKTYFIIDDKENYENVRKSTEYLNLFPEIPLHLSNVPHIYLRFYKCLFIFEPFENTGDNYANILQVPVPENGDSLRNGCLFGLALIIILISILFQISSCERRNYLLEEYYKQYKYPSGILDYKNEGSIIYDIDTVENYDSSVEDPYDIE